MATRIKVAGSSSKERKLLTGRPSGLGLRRALSRAE